MGLLPTAAHSRPIQILFVSRRTQTYYSTRSAVLRHRRSVGPPRVCVVAGATIFSRAADKGRYGFVSGALLPVFVDVSEQIALAPALRLGSAWKWVHTGCRAVDPRTVRAS